MRKIINGKLYDTDTARAIVSWSDGYASDFRFIAETLYRKRTGEYFLFGEGGPMSPYAESCGQNQWQGGKAIKPLTYEQARQWAEDHADVSVYEMEFGVPDEDKEHDLHVIISETAWQSIARTATRDEVAVRTIIERLAETL